MKRIISIFVVSFLMVVALIFAAISLSNRDVSATEAPKEKRQVVSELLESYINENGQYTKLTTLATENITELGGSYHGGANQSQRRTYYDENVNALLMGDYNGGFEHINSGYAKQSADVNNMQHYRNNADEKALANLFTSRSVDYAVNNTNPVAYFDVLSDLVKVTRESSESDWNEEDGVYTYTTSHETGYLSSTDPYNDGLLKQFQYFAAPMLLVNNSLKLAKIRISVADCYDGGIDEGIYKEDGLLVIEVLNIEDKLISTCYVLSGLTMG